MLAGVSDKLLVVLAEQVADIVLKGHVLQLGHVKICLACRIEGQEGKQQDLLLL